MAEFRYVGEPVSNWYGLDLTGDQVVTLPDHLVAKAALSPMFEAVKASTADEPEPETPEDDEPEASENEDETVEAEKPAPRRRGRPRKTQG